MERNGVIIGAEIRAAVKDMCGLIPVIQNRAERTIQVTTTPFPVRTLAKGIIIGRPATTILPADV